MKIQLRGLFRATIPALLAFILMDALVEFIIFKSTGVSLLSYFEQTLHIHYGFQFYFFNIILFSFEMLLVMFFYAMIRPQFVLKTKPIAITIIFFIGFIGLFLVQLINVGIYPIQPALIFGVSTLVGFPVAVFIGALVYERTFFDNL